MQRIIETRRITLGRAGLETCQLGFRGIPIQKVDELHAHVLNFGEI